MHIPARRTLAGTIALIALTSCAPSSDTARSVTVDPNRIEGHMQFLVDDAMKGRETGTPELYISETYVASQFKAYGLEPGGDGDSYFQAVPLRQSMRDPSGSVFRLNRNGRSIAFAQGTDFHVAPSVSEAASAVTAPVVFVGYGEYSLEHNINDFAGLDVEGMIVARLAGRSTASATFDPHITPRPSQAAEMHGAVGTITLTLPGGAAAFAAGARTNQRPRTTWVDKGGQPFLATRNTIGTQINATLSSVASARLFEGAAQSYAEVVEAAGADELRPVGFQLPVEATIAQASHHSAAESRNVLAILRGSDPVLADEYVVITCHLDHVGIGPAVDGDSIYNGAMDNATGVAFMLEVARVLALTPDKPKRSVLFYATTAEEHGLIGSSYYVNNPTVPLERIIANINVDAPRMFWPFDEITAFGAEHATLRTSIQKAVESMGYSLDEGIRYETGASDHFSFLRAGVPGTRVIPAVRSSDPTIDAEAIMARYRPHQPSDQLSLPFDYRLGAEFSEVIRTIVVDIANDEAGIEWIVGDPLAR